MGGASSQPADADETPGIFSLSDEMQAQLAQDFHNDQVSSMLMMTARLAAPFRSDHVVQNPVQSSPVSSQNIHGPMLYRLLNSLGNNWKRLANARRLSYRIGWNNVANSSITWNNFVPTTIKSKNNWIKPWKHRKINLPTRPIFSNTTWNG